MSAPSGGAPTRDPLPIRSVEFLGPMATVAGWRPETKLPEIAFSGRSNVGKSSLINKLTRRKDTARVSKTPGRTREINFFEINKQFVLADLPGYGYARVAKDRQAEWRPLIEGYLRRSALLKGIVQLLDARRDPTEEDLAMFDLLYKLELPVLVCATKIDKLKRGEVTATIAKLGKAVGVDVEQIIPFSATTGEGRDELAEAIVGLVASGPAAD